MYRGEHLLSAAVNDLAEGNLFGLRASNKCPIIRVFRQISLLGTHKSIKRRFHVHRLLKTADIKVSLFFCFVFFWHFAASIEQINCRIES